MAGAYGYIRVSSTDQNESRQRIALERQAIPSDRIFMDKLSGKDFQRPQYQAMLKKFRPGICSALRALTGWAETMRKFWNSGG